MGNDNHLVYYHSCHLSGLEEVCCLPELPTLCISFYISLFFLLISVSFFTNAIMASACPTPHHLPSIRRLNNHSLQLILLSKQSININGFLGIAASLHALYLQSVAICLSLSNRKGGALLERNPQTGLQRKGNKKKVWVEKLIHSERNTMNLRHLLISCKKRQPSGSGRDLFSFPPCIHPCLPPPVNADPLK